MKAIDRLGLFWVPGHDDDSNKLSGRLQFDPTGGGINLSLVGAFDNPVTDSDKSDCRLFGWLGSDPVTLDGCYLAGTNHRSPGVIESRYHANYMFVGHHVESSEQRFKSATATFSYADCWINKSGIEVATNYGRNQSEPTAIYTATFTPIPQAEHPFSRGKIQLGYNWEPDGDPIRGVSMRQWPVFTIRYDELRPSEEIQDDVRLVQNLITLCMDAPVDLDQLVLRHPDIHLIMLSGRDSGAEQPIQLVMSPIPYTAPEKRKARYPHQMLLTFDELGGLPAIARWLDIAPPFRRALNSLLSVKYAERMFAENRFLNVTFAAEAFHRVTQNAPHMEPSEFERLLSIYIENTPEEYRDWLTNKIGYGNEPTLVKRLRRLATRAGAAARPLIGNKDRWAGTLSQVRNELTHLNTESPEFDGGDLVWFTESVYAVVRICMLLECGVSIEAIAAKAGSHELAWYHGRLMESIERVRDQLRRVAVE